MGRVAGVQLEKKHRRRRGFYISAISFMRRGF
jgi:hypothetical protein